jgi:hypothetical protein
MGRPIWSFTILWERFSGVFRRNQQMLYKKCEKIINLELKNRFTCAIMGKQ